MPRLLILTPGELTRDPRALRAATAAVQHGIDVVAASGSVTGDVPRRLDGVEIVRVGGDRISGALRGLGLGGMKSSPAPVRELRGLFRLARLVRLNFRLAHAAKRFERIDAVHANDFDTLPAGWLAARRAHARLVYDSHEVYASQEIDPPRIFRAVALALERVFARRAHVVTTGDPYAGELVRSLGLSVRPSIVLNAPARVEEEPPARESGGPLRVVYQAAMGAGRPLEDILDAAKETHGVAYTLRVLGADRGLLERQIAARGIGEVVRLAEPLPPDRLLEGLWGHDVGLIINRPVSLTDELVVPNKLFEYMMARLAVVGPNLPGLSPVIDGDRVGATFAPGDPRDLAAALQRLAADRVAVTEMGRRARALALARYNAEAQEQEFMRAWGVS
jgi:glycosyltransferase involved in cell wall biosynthesis